MLGHLWTIVPHLVRGRGSGFDIGDAWSTPGPDLGRGPIDVRGFYGAVGGSDTAVVVVHGLGGSPDSAYVRAVARTLHEAGLSVLRMGLRGSDEHGQDLYHAALTDDLAATLSSPALAPYKKIGVIGFSLGGHIALRWAMRPTDSRVTAVCAVCPPLDLAACAVHLDSPAQSLYRNHVLKGLKDMFTRVHARNPMPIDPRAVAKVNTIRGWDETVVVPRYGFGSADNYYAIASAGPRLSELQVPTLLIEATRDPMIPAASAAPHIGDHAQHPNLTVRRTLRGGHVGFVPWLDLGFAGPRGLEGQLAAWIRSQSG